MTYDKIIDKIIDSYLNYTADEYYDRNNILRQGLNKYNEKLDKHEYLKLDIFTSGKYEKMLTSFLFVSLKTSNSISGTYVGDGLGYTDNINISVKIYKQTKPPHIWLAYSVIPIVLNQVSREWIAYSNENEKDFTIYNININMAEPILDVNNDNQKTLNDFSSIKGVAIELNINITFQSTSNYEDEDNG